ncbi:MAG: DUF1254 domain-containing protein [Nocardioides sp.]|nr:DUF1254 domain-containing protein [Nocardioidaceae bacterium]MCB8956599.1 DUF1254 domain-containing protein [Nocardioides sp.]
MPTPVNVENFVRAETDTMMAGLAAKAGGVNRWLHNRTPTPLDDQPVIRQNRDTLYSFAIVDISQGATVTLPDAGARYLSAMVVNQDHYINAVLHDPGTHELTVEDHQTPHVLVAIRILADPTDPADLAEVATLQDRLRLEAGSATPYDLPDYDADSHRRTRDALLALAAGVSGFGRAFGRRTEVDPVQHLIGTAAGWGGLPDHEAHYVNVQPGLPIGAYELVVPADVPVDGFWSISLYDAAGYFPTDAGERVSVNNVTARPDDDGSVTVRFGGDPDLPNRLPVVEGWNYLVRFYRPRAEVRDGSWSMPPVHPVG